MKKLKLNKKNVTRIRRAVSILITALIILLTCVLPTFAADSNTGIESAFGKLIDLLVGIVRMVGIVFLIWGGVEFAQAQNSHDGPSRLKGIWLFVTGLFIFFIKELLNYIGVNF